MEFEQDICDALEIPKTRPLLTLGCYKVSPKRNKKLVLKLDSSMLKTKLYLRQNLPCLLFFV